MLVLDSAADNFDESRAMKSSLLGETIEIEKLPPIRANSAR